MKSTNQCSTYFPAIFGATKNLQSLFRSGEEKMFVYSLARPSALIFAAYYLFRNLFSRLLFVLAGKARCKLTLCPFPDLSLLLYQENLELELLVISSPYFCRSLTMLCQDSNSGCLDEKSERSTWGWRSPNL